MTSKYDPEAIAIGRAVRGAVAAAGLSLDEAAERAGITGRTMSRRVNGEPSFSFPELIRIASVCGIRASELAQSAERILEQSASGSAA